MFSLYLGESAIQVELEPIQIQTGGSKMGHNKAQGVLCIELKEIDLHTANLKSHISTHLKITPVNNNWHKPQTQLKKSNEFISIAAKYKPVNKNQQPSQDQHASITINPGYICINSIGERKQLAVINFIKQAEKPCIMLGIYDLEITAKKAGRTIITLTDNKISESIIIDVTPGFSLSKKKIEPKTAVYCQGTA